MGEMMVGLAESFAFNNSQRLQLSMGKKKLEVVYRAAIGFGAANRGKFTLTVEEPHFSLRSTELFISAETRSEATAKAKAKPGQRRPAVRLPAETVCPIPRR